MGTKQSRARVDQRLEKVRSKNYPPDLEKLLCELQELAYEAGFEHQEAARRMAHDEDEPEKPKQWISTALNPDRSRPKPPRMELVESFLRLHQERLELRPAQARHKRERINDLYRKADAACEISAVEAKAKQNPDLTGLQQTIGQLRTEIAARDQELKRLRAESGESARTRNGYEDRIHALNGELTDLRRQLAEMTTERDQLSSREQQAVTERDQVRDRLMRVTAESDQQQARLAELKSATNKTDSPVLLYPTAQRLRDIRRNRWSSYRWIAATAVCSFMCSYCFAVHLFGTRILPAPLSTIDLSRVPGVVMTSIFNAAFVPLLVFFVSAELHTRRLSLRGARFTSRGVRFRTGREIRWNKIANLQVTWPEQTPTRKKPRKKFTIEVLAHGGEVLATVPLTLGSDDAASTEFNRLERAIKSAAPHITGIAEANRQRYSEEIAALRQKRSLRSDRFRQQPAPHAAVGGAAGGAYVGGSIGQVIDEAVSAKKRKKA